MRRLPIIVCLLATLLAVAACGNKRRPLPTQAELLRQDSLERLKHQPKAKTYATTEEELLATLPYRTLPVTYEEGFEHTLPGFGDIYPTMVPSLFGVEGLTKTKAIRLPDHKGCHVFLVGGQDAENMEAVYMVTLDSLSWRPIDQLTLYEVWEPEEEDDEEEESDFVEEEDLGRTRIEFSVTSRYEIYIQEVFQSYADDSRELQGVSVYSIGSKGEFYELEHNKLNHGAE